jgi:hypothetical protein
MDKADIEKRIDEFITCISDPVTGAADENEKSGPLIEDAAGENICAKSNILSAAEIEAAIAEEREKISARIDGYVETSATAACRMLEESWSEYTKGDYEKAMELIKSSLLEYLRGGARDAAGISEAYYGAGEIYIARRLFADAVNSFDDAEAWLDKSLKKHAAEESQKLSKCIILKARAYAYFRLEDPARAVDDMRAALTEIISLRGLNDELTAICYKELADYLTKAGKAKEALEFIGQSLSAYRKLIEINGREIEAKPETNAAGAEKENSAEKKHKVSFNYINDAYDVLFNILAELGAYGAILKAYDELQAHMEAFGLASAVELAKFENYRAAVFSVMTDYRGAEEHYSAAAELVKNFPAEDEWRNIITADALKGTAEMRIKLNDTASGIFYYETAVPFYISYLAAGNLRAAEDLLDICDALVFRLNEFATAMKIYCSTLDTLGACGSAETVPAGKVYYYAGAALVDNGFEEKGMEFIKTAAGIFEKNGRNDLVERARKNYPC